MGSASQPVELSSDEEVESALEAGAVAAPSRKRSRPSQPATRDPRAVSVDLTLDDDDAGQARCPSGGSAGPSTSGFGGGPSDGGIVVIDLCDGDDDDSPASSFAQQLNLLFDGVELVGERRDAGGGSSRDCVALDSDDECQVGSGTGGASGRNLTQDQLDAQMAARIQAQLDAESEAEAADRERGVDDDAAFAAALQARLAREIEASESQDGPPDLLVSQRNQIRSWLSANAARLKVKDVWSNPAAAPGGRLYERFSRAHEAARDKSVRLVFHGTREENIEDDPRRRGKNGQAYGAGEYFAERPDVSIPYCGGGSRMLVFAVLMDRSGITNRVEQSGIVVVNKVEHQLPMFVVTFESMMPNPSHHAAAALASARALLASSGASAAVYARVRQMLGGSVPPSVMASMPAPRGRTARPYKPRARRQGPRR